MLSCQINAMEKIKERQPIREWEIGWILARVSGRSHQKGNH